jgi:hypothetical protein
MFQVVATGFYLILANHLGLLGRVLHLLGGILCSLRVYLCTFGTMRGLELLQQSVVSLCLCARWWCSVQSER